MSKFKSDLSSQQIDCPLLITLVKTRDREESECSVKQLLITRLELWQGKPSRRRLR